MRRPTDPLSPRTLPRWKLTAFVGGAVLGLVFAATATIGLLIGPPDTTISPAVENTRSPATISPGARQSATPAMLSPVVSTADAEQFARSAAETLFEWDTLQGFQPRDYAQIIVDAGDADSGELNGLAEDTSNYLPSQAAWVELQKYETTQSLRIDRLWVPERWQDVLDQARDGAILPGTVAYTVEGMRLRTGLWDGDVVETAHPVSFTLFVVCKPSYTTCRLLRLSALDTPLQ
ncbi:hypothetical protein G7066_08855 [Leucobacter coleopterorum]|uniref:Uncharacterized protein n=1 Tax=Leucobacter coleopterorum TaxID=2714933 RepID=A0ABX6JWR9_9MICO|nr:hypothetical protein [Leucobacter coleopterorum]QIM18692.1 hypothetical protein G7066_08855 [Leucobacter coleopterorum]